jgi:hypothetical protein
MDDIDENIFKVDLDGGPSRMAQSQQSSVSKHKVHSNKRFTAFSPPSI